MCVVEIFNPSKPTGYSIYRRVEHSEVLPAAHIVYLFVFCVCQNTQLDWSVYTCLTQLYGGRDMYNLLHKELHVSALFIGHLQVDK